jgi:hypothetical protein
MKEDKKVIITRKYIIEEQTLSDGTKSIIRTNDGFAVFELLGLFAFINDELLMKVKEMMTPDTVRKEIISHD